MTPQITPWALTTADKSKGKNDVINAQILDFVRKSGSCSRKEITAAFDDIPSTLASRKRLDNIINYLAYKGRLKDIGNGGRRLWVLGDEASAPPPGHRPRKPVPVHAVLQDAIQTHCPPAAPRVVDVMKALCTSPFTAVAPVLAPWTSCAFPAVVIAADTHPINALPPKDTHDIPT